MSAPIKSPACARAAERLLCNVAADSCTQHTRDQKFAPSIYATASIQTTWKHDQYGSTRKKIHSFSKHKHAPYSLARLVPLSRLGCNIGPLQGNHHAQSPRCLRLWARDPSFPPPSLAFAWIITLFCGWCSMLVRYGEPRYTQEIDRDASYRQARDESRWKVSVVMGLEASLTVGFLVAVQSRAVLFSPLIWICLATSSIKTDGLRLLILQDSEMVMLLERSLTFAQSESMLRCWRQRGPINPRIEATNIEFMCYCVMRNNAWNFNLLAFTAFLFFPFLILPFEARLLTFSSLIVSDCR